MTDTDNNSNTINEIIKEDNNTNNNEVKTEQSIKVDDDMLTTTATTTNIENKEEDKENNEENEYEKYLKLTIDSADTLLLLNIISKYEIEKPTFDWQSIYSILNLEFEKLKLYKIIPYSNILSFKTEEETKLFYNKIQDIFSKNHINLEKFIKNKRIELIRNQIEQFSKQLKEKEEYISNIKLNYLNELEKEKEKEKQEPQPPQQQQTTTPEKIIEIESEKEKEKQGSTITTAVASTPKPKRKQSSLSSNLTLSTSSTLINQQTPEEKQLEEEQKRKEEEQQRASSKKILYTSMTKVWKALNAHRFAYIFRYPITKEDAPDYDSVIKHRMDLTTLKKKLDDQQYNSCNEFYKDIVLIFKNAMAYNQEDSDIYNMAGTMKKLAEKEMEPCFATEELLQSGAGNSLGTRSNRKDNQSGSNTPLNTSSSGNSMPSPSIRGRNKPLSISNNNVTTTSQNTTPTRSKKGGGSSSNANYTSESDQSNPNTPSLTDDTIDTSDHDTAPKKSSTRTTTRSSSRNKTTAESTPELKEDTISISTSKKVSKRQRNTKTDETITHQDD